MRTPGTSWRRSTPAVVASLVTVVGSLLGARPGEALRLRGRWGSHPQYGRQFVVEDFSTVLPATVQGVRRYLGSGLIKGIGPKLADGIVDHFGVAALEVIETAPQRLVEVPGLGPKRTRLITAAWEEQKAIKEVMVFLQGIGVSTSLAVRIFKRYADASIGVVRTEPYRLAADVWGIGFKTADTIAQAVGIPHDSPQRVKAGLQFTLSEATSDGHCFLPEQDLIRAAIKILQVDTGLVIDCLAELVAEQGVVREPIPDPATGEPVVAVFLVPFHRAEISLAGQLRALARTEADRLPGFAGVDWDRALGWLHSRTGTELAPEQAAAVRLALTEKVAVLTGGPGCGKSFTVRSIVTLAAAKGAKIVLAAPTGRAAKRLTQLAGHDAVTVHRLLELRPGGDAAYDREHPLDADLVVVDEASMLDLLLANKLVKAIPPGAHLLLVGDVDQLPSVGAGEVLRDLLAPGSPLPSVRLTRIFRQAARSGVVTNAHRINAGDYPQVRGLPDFFLFPAEDADTAATLTVDVVTRRIPARFGLDPQPRHPGADPDAPRPGRRRGAEHRAAGRDHPDPDRPARTPLRRPGLPGRRQGVPDPQQLRQGRQRCLQRHPGRRDRRRPERRHAHRAHRGRRGHRLRLQRTGRTDPRLRGDRAPRPGQRVPVRGHPDHHQLMDDAATQPALHRRHPSQETRRPRRITPRPSARPSASPAPAAATPPWTTASPNAPTARPAPHGRPTTTLPLRSDPIAMSISPVVPERATA